MYHNSIIDTIGNTPLIRLNNVNKGIKGAILVKVEYFNPGNSVKDRMALKMIEDAEKSGQLKPGGTIVEGTSGNTGMGLALAAISKGYKCVFTLADKQSKEKIDILRAVGAEVIVCPTNVAPDDPKSYYSVAQKIASETPNSFYCNQYDNLSNTVAHYETTGPEIWEQTEGKITHFAAGVGTGGTMCGVSKYLKEKKPGVQSIGIDSYGSVFKKYKETGEFDEKEVYPYLTEGIGEDILPKNVDFELIDSFVKVTDKDAAIMARRMAREEGLFIGWSCGSAVFGALEYARNHMKDDDLMVIILPDHGTRYLNKIQVPVTDGDDFVGSITDSRLLKSLLENPEVKNDPIESVMDAPLQFVGMDNTLDVLSSLIDNDKKALLVRDEKNEVHIITQHDILVAMTS
jgi:cystathionine beta-synthase